jgi:hypothetical protein
MGSAGTLGGPNQIHSAFADQNLMIEDVFEQKLRLLFPVVSSVVPAEPIVT